MSRIAILLCAFALNIAQAFPDSSAKESKRENALSRIDYSRIHGALTEGFDLFMHDFPFDLYRIVCPPNPHYRDRFYVEKNTKDYVSNLLISGGAWETYHRDYILKYVRPGSIAIDLGAHMGTHTITMSHAVGEEGRVLAFEPNADRFRQLVLNVAGLGNAQNVDFYLQAAHLYNEQIDHSPLNHGGPVETFAIDSLGLSNVSLIKIDTDGTPENAILRGLENTIRTNKPVILLEISGGLDRKRASEEQKRYIKETKQYVIDLGYRLICFKDIYGGCPWDFLCLPI